MLRSLLAALLAALCLSHRAESKEGELTIPDIPVSKPRAITIDDTIRLRGVDTLSVAPDGNHFAVFVRQADPAKNEYRAGWFVGAIRPGPLRYAGTGGEVRPSLESYGFSASEIVGPKCAWSPDGKWIAYTLRHNGETQIWRSRPDGSFQGQLTHNPADIHELAWSEDGRAVYFSVGTARAELRAREERMIREGYQYDEDIYTFTNLMERELTRPPETHLAVWMIDLAGGHERLADEAEQMFFNRSIAATAASDASPTRRNGNRAWLEHIVVGGANSQLKASISERGSKPIPCPSPHCTGALKKVWWGDDGSRILFWRGEGIGDREPAFYAWTPGNNEVSVLARMPDETLDFCEKAVSDRVICVRETKKRPAHLVTIDLRTGAVELIADLNPEYRNIRLGAVERFEWDTPRFTWNEPGGQLAGLYPKRAYGYIMYPPNFDPAKKYPVFVDPYVAHGFNPSVGGEHALHVYAANGFVVLNTAFPWPDQDRADRMGGDMMRQLYLAALDYPHLTMLMESTARGIQTAMARGFIDEHRIGIGGVSHGTFIPLYLLQKHDLIAAISISSPSWGPHEYYWATRKQREVEASVTRAIGESDWRVKPEGEGREFWGRIDIADHVDAIEAPILMNLADQETYGVLRFIRNLGDARKPYDAYIFREENHIKWQPAHLQAIQQRNLDWFRFWLQNHEDPDSQKAEQYQRWRELRKMKNGPDGQTSSR